MASTPPTGTVTFLFTDIQGSTRLAQDHPDAMPALLARHNELLNQAIEAHAGLVFRVVGDSFSAAFHNASDALQAALDAQRALQGETWSPAAVPVRMGLHTGDAQFQADPNGDTYTGYATLALAQRIMSAGHGGQILLSQSTYELTRHHSEAARFADMGEHRLKDIQRLEHLYQATVPGLPFEFPPLKTLDSFPNNLPLQLTSFIGREKEIGEIKALMETSRLVTLTGSGGTGKTRLSQEVASQLLPAYRHGVWWLELAILSEEAQIIPALAQVFGLQELPFTPLASTLTDYLRDKSLLLILDNCEHLIQPCAQLANDLLHQCAGLKLLASSREALGIAGEAAYRVPSLADEESTRLFVERARASNSSFRQTGENSPAIAQICHRLDGIPLAIELAAARTKLLSVEQVATRLDDMFRLLIGGSRTALPRQQTLRAMIDWSYDLLSDEEKRLLQVASVFVGGWTLEALEAVADEPQALDLLEQLVNKSMVVTEEHEHQMRYFMLETIRQYAREKLFDAKQAAQARDRHFFYFDKLSGHMWQTSLRLSEFTQLHDQAFDEAENMRAAVEWGLDNQPEAVVHLAATSVIASGWTGSLVQALQALDRAVTQFRQLPPVEGDDPARRQALLAFGLYAQGTMVPSIGDLQTGEATLKEAIAIYRQLGDRRLLSYCLQMYYGVLVSLGAPDAAQYAEEGLAISTELNDAYGLNMARLNMARVALARGDQEESERYFDLIRQRMKQAPITFLSAITYLMMGYGERSRGRLDSARQQFESGLEIARPLRHREMQNVFRAEMGHIARLQGDAATAEATYRQSILVFQELGNRAAVAHQLECFAFLAVTAEEPERAARLLGAAEALRERVKSVRAEHEHEEYDRAVISLRSMLPARQCDALWAQGRALTMDSAIQLALENG